MAKQSYKKFVASAATATLVASALVPVASANVTTSAFTDVPASYKDAVEFVVTNNIASGLTATQFGISQQIKRGDVAIMIAAAAGLNDEKAPASGFSDVPKRGALAINSLKAAGVISGKTTTKFGFEDNVTRGEAALMLQKAFGLEGKKVDSKFTDVSSRYKEAVDALLANKVTSGVSATKYGTDNNIKRGDFAKFLYALKDRIEAPGVKVDSVTVKDATTLNVAVKEANKELTAADFNVLVDGTKVELTKVESDSVGATYTLTIPTLDGKKGTVTVNGTAADYNFESAKVQSINATNGKLVVQLTNKLDTTPISSEFKVVQNINGTTKSVAPSSVAYDADAKTVTLVVPQISSTEADQNVSYTVGYKETAPVSSNSFTVAKVGELAVSSVTALSSTQVKVNFNQKVTTSAENSANYKLGKAGADGKVSGAYTAFSVTNPNIALQDDEQSVIITLADDTDVSGVLATAGYFDNNTTFLLEISNNILPKAGKAAEANIEKPFTINDTTKPAVDKFQVNEAGGLVVTFNEKLDAATPVKVVINGQALTAVPSYSAGLGKSRVTFTKAQLTAVKPTGFGLELGKTYTVSVADSKDVYGTAMNIYTSQFTYATVADAPQVVSVKAEDEASFIVKFSEPVNPVDATKTLTGTSALGFQITKGAKQFAAPTVTLLDDGVSYLVEFAAADLGADEIYNRYNKENNVNLDIYVTDIKDATGNITPASKQTVTLTKDTVKPAVVKKENKAAGVVELTFNKTLNSSVTQATIAPKAYVLTSSGVKLPLATGDVTTVNNSSGKISFDLKTVGAQTLNDGNYTLVLEEGAVVDTALNGGNKNNEVRVPFIIAADGLVKKPVVNSVTANATPGDISVAFNEQVSYESAAKAANYTLDGQALPAASQFALSADGKTLTITLPEATYKESGSKVLKINGVRNLAGTVMDQYEAVVPVSENEKIEMKSAKVVNGDIIVTFNENVDTTTLTGGSAAPFVNTDFLVKVNGVTVASPTVSNNTNDTVTPKVEKNQVRISAPAGYSFATGTVTVEVLEAAAAKDVAGNKAKAVTVTATR